MNLEELFIQLGYTQQEFNHFIGDYSLARLKYETLYKNVVQMYQFLVSIGYTKEEVLKITKSHPSIYGYPIESIKQKIDDMISLGYTKEEVLKISKIIPNIYGRSIKSIKQKIDDMISLGYTKEEVLKITKQSPSIYGYSIESIKQKIEDLINLGYTKEEVLKMTKSFPPIYGCTIENIKQKIEELINLGYTKEEVLKITKSFPSIFGFIIESIKQKIVFYDSINMHELAVINAKYLMQSISLSFARYMFLNTKGIDVTMSNYRILFAGSKRFEKQHNITKKQLLEMYNYENYVREKTNERVI